MLRSSFERHFGRAIDLFLTWDTDSSGTVDFREFTRALRALGLDAPPSEVRALFDELDAAGEGALSYRALHRSLRQGQRVRLACELREGYASGADGRSTRLDTAMARENRVALRGDVRDEWGVTHRTAAGSSGVLVQAHDFRNA